MVCDPNYHRPVMMILNRYSTSDSKLKKSPINTMQ